MNSSPTENSIVATQIANVSSNTGTRLLVTGANGFLGKAVVRQSERAGMEVTTCGRGDNSNGFSNYLQIDLVSEDLSSLVAGQDSVIHCAGLAHQFGKKGDDPRPFFAANVQATQRLLQAAIKAGVEHFVLISSVGVYGTNESGLPLDEKSPCHPNGHYAESKLEGERQAIAIAKRNKIRLTVVRMATIFGEGDRGNISRLMKAIDQRKFASIGPGENRKSLIYLQDAARACVTTVERPGRQRTNIEIYNVTSPSVEMSKVTDGLASALMRPKPLVLPVSLVVGAAKLLSAVSFGRGPFPRVEKTVDKWLSNDVFDGNKFRNEFNFESRVTLEQGLAKQVAHYRDQSQWVASEWRGKRAMDLALALVAFAVFLIPMIVIGIIVRRTSKGVAIYWSDRVGKDNKVFSMAKFRTMRTDTPEVATDLLNDSENWITPIGKFLRKTSLDELPQLWNVLKGDMSIVGSRPPLHNQYELLALRTARGVSQIRPGLTGWVAINGRDEVCDPLKVEMDRYYVQNVSPRLDLKIIYKTFLKVLKREGVKEGSEDVAEQPQILRIGKDITLVATADCVNSVAVAAERLVAHGISASVIGITETAQLNTREIAEMVGSINKSLFVSREMSGLDSSENLQLPEFRLPKLVLSEDPNEIVAQLASEASKIVEQACDDAPAESKPAAIELEVI